MTILADMRLALEAEDRTENPALFWRVGGGALHALHADLNAEGNAGSARWETHAGRRELASVLGYPVVDTRDFEGSELCRESEPTPLQPRRKRRK